MRSTPFDRDWTLRVLDPLTLKLGGKQPVSLPHDHSIGQPMDPNTFATASNAYLPGGVLEYEKAFELAPDAARRKVVLLFEGVYMNATVCVNGHIAARQPYGYSSFLCDMTPYLLADRANVLTVRVNNTALPNCRWYSGTGIYRHVWLLTGSDAFIKPWGVWVSTPSVSEDSAVFEIVTSVGGEASARQGALLRQRLLDADGGEVGSSECVLDGGDEAEITQRIAVANPRLWSPDDPYLYSLVTELCIGGEVIDSVTTQTGARSISVKPGLGFVLNGQPIKLKGGCVHHDCGLLGAAAHDRAEQRKVELLKANGFNAVRCAHNPPSPAFLDACDRLGLIVIDEAFDCWRVAKLDNDYSLYFDDWWQRDLSAMVLRDRNHPSVCMWSIGNEIPERNCRSGGVETTQMLCEAVRKLDATRPITNALCALWSGEQHLLDWGETTAPFAAPLDVVGYNYLVNRYAEDCVRYPDRLICGTETFAKDAFEYWEAVEAHPNVIGDFVWTALDYLGEAGIGRVLKGDNELFVGAYPWSHANCGDIDLCGGKRPQSHYRDCVWGISKAPYIAVHHPAKSTGKEVKLTPWGYPDVAPCWNWPGYEGDNVRVDVYSEAGEVELLLNGRSLGMQPAGKAHRYIASFELPYAPGTLTAVAHGAEKQVTALKTPGAATRLRLTADRVTLDRGEGDLCYVDVALVDEDGNLADQSDATVYVTASGAGKIAAIGSANPETDERYVGNARRLYRGRAMAIVRAIGESGEIVITASAEGVQSDALTIQITKEG